MTDVLRKHIVITKTAKETNDNHASTFIWRFGNPVSSVYLRGIKLYATKIIRYHQWINTDSKWSYDRAQTHWLICYILQAIAKLWRKIEGRVFMQIHNSDSYLVTFLIRYALYCGRKLMDIPGNQWFVAFHHIFVRLHKDNCCHQL